MQSALDLSFCSFTNDAVEGAEEKQSLCPRGTPSLEEEADRCTSLDSIVTKSPPGRAGNSGGEPKGGKRTVAHRGSVIATLAGPWMLAGSTEWPHPDWGSPLNFLGVKGRDGFGLKTRDEGVWVT